MKRLFIYASCALAVTAVPAAANPSTVAAVSAVLSRPTVVARKVEIGRQVARMCNLSLSGDDLDRASAFIEANRGKGVAWVADQISKSELSYVCGS
jgi:hypothetical protein